MDDNRQRLIALIGKIDQELAEASALASDCPDPELGERLAVVLAELREALERAEGMLGHRQ